MANNTSIGHAARTDKTLPNWNATYPSPSPLVATIHQGATGSGTIDDEHYRATMIAMRLRLQHTDWFPYQYLSTALTGDKVFVFVVQDGQPVVLEDDATMFPSDALITQLRLLEK